MEGARTIAVHERGRVPEILHVMLGSRRIQSSMKHWPAILLLLFHGLGFAQTSDPALIMGIQLLEEGRTTLEEKPLVDARDAFTQLTQKSGSNQAYFYNLARVDFYITDFYSARRDNKAAERSLDEAITAAQHAITLDDKSSNAHSLLADLYGRKISFGSFFAGMRYGPKVEAENKKALELDPDNPRVQASLGRQYLFAPKMFGGDLNQAVASFRKAVQLDPKSDEAFVWLAIALRKKEDKENADKALQEALRLNPRSEFAKRTAREK